MLIELKIFAISAGLVLGISALAMVVAWLFLGLPRPLWPPRRNRLVSWGGLEVLCAFATLELLLPLALFALFFYTGLFRWIYDHTGGDFTTTFGTDEDKLSRHLAIWAPCLGFPVTLALLAIWGRLWPHFHPYQLGLTRSRLWQSLVLGWLGWLAFGLPCDLFYLFLSNAYQWLFPGQSEIHTIMKIASEHPSTFEWIVLCVSAIVVAPVLEELLFRGLLLRWLCVRPQGVLIVLILTMTMAFVGKSAKFEEAWNSRDSIGLLASASPLIFSALVVASLRCLEFLSLNPRQLNQWRAILSSALLFAIFHANFWPTPVPLFFLAIFLGWLACRTQSILPGMVTHALFNSVACVELLFGLSAL